MWVFSVYIPRCLEGSRTEKKPKQTILQFDFPGAQSTVRTGQGLAKQSFSGNALAVAWPATAERQSFQSLHFRLSCKQKSPLQALWPSGSCLSPVLMTTGGCLISGAIPSSAFTKKSQEHFIIFLLQSRESNWEDVSIQGLYTSEELQAQMEKKLLPKGAQIFSVKPCFKSRLLNPNFCPLTLSQKGQHLKPIALFLCSVPLFSISIQTTNSCLPSQPSSRASTLLQMCMRSLLVCKEQCKSKKFSPFGPQMESTLHKDLSGTQRPSACICPKAKAPVTPVIGFQEKQANLFTVLSNLFSGLDQNKANRHSPIIGFQGKQANLFIFLSNLSIFWI